MNLQAQKSRSQASRMSQEDLWSQRRQQQRRPAREENDTHHAEDSLQRI